MKTMTNLIELPSVGCVVDITTQLTYPQFEDGKPDLNCPVPLAECTTEWYDSLSAHDDAVVFAIRYIKW